MKILYHIPYPNALDAGRFIYDGWSDAFKSLGHSVLPLTASDNIIDKVQEIKPDIFISAVNLVPPGQKEFIYKEIKKCGTKILLWVDWPLDPTDLELFKNKDIVDVYFGERELSSMEDFIKQTGQNYHLIANAANKKIHFPVPPSPKYEYDIVYLGACLPMKKKFFEEVLFPLRKKYKVGIFGPGWTKKDFFLGLCSRISRKLKFHGLVKFFNILRISVPINEENLLYSSAKIALNFHEQDSEGGYSHNIINQRTFKIPACGGFEICDNVPALRNYFKDDEVVVAKEKEDWGRLIEYYLSHPDERIKIQKKGTSRALSDHTYEERAKQILDLCKG